MRKLREKCLEDYFICFELRFIDWCSILSIVFVDAKYRVCILKAIYGARIHLQKGRSIFDILEALEFELRNSNSVRVVYIDGGSLFDEPKSLESNFRQLSSKLNISMELCVLGLPYHGAQKSFKRKRKNHKFECCERYFEYANIDLWWSRCCAFAQVIPKSWLRLISHDIKDETRYNIPAIIWKSINRQN